MVVAAIKEETFPEIEQHAKTVHWMSLGQLGKLIKTFKSEGVDQAVMAGQVKHKQIFSSIVPDFKMIQLLASLAAKNTDSLIGAVARVLENEGIRLVDSTLFLRPLLPEPGALTRRPPSEEEQRDLDYGYRIARELGRLDLGQSVVVTDGACVALEAMEGTDEAIRRGLRLAGPGAVVVKATASGHDYRFDVPAVGAATLALCVEGRAAALAVEAGRVLLLDRETVAAEAARAGISVVGVGGGGGTD